MLKLIIPLILSLWSASAVAEDKVAPVDNKLKSLTLDAKTAQATACATVDVFLKNERFSVKGESSTVVVIEGDNDMFKNLPKEKTVCLKGTYVEGPKGGIVRHITIKNAALVFEDVFETLAKDDKLQILVLKTEKEWLINDSDNGSTLCRAGILKGKLDENPKALAALSEENFRIEAGLNQDPDFLNGAILETTTAKLSEKDHIELVFEAFAAGQATPTSNTQIKRVVVKQLKAFIEALGEKESILALITKAKVKVDPDDDSDEAETKNAHSIVFLNKISKKAVRLFIIANSD